MEVSRVLAVDKNDLILELQVEPILGDLGNEVGGPALDGVRRPCRMSLGGRTELAEDSLPLLLCAARDQGGRLGLGEDDLHIGPRCLDNLPGTVEGASSAVA